MDIVQRLRGKAGIVTDGKVLIVREAATYDEATNAGKYDLPGGRINAAEPFRIGLAREIKEETGQELEIGKIICAGEWFPEIKGIKNHIVAMFFICHIPSGVVVLSNEHDDYQWVNNDTMRNYTMSPPNYDVIETYFSMN